MTVPNPSSPTLLRALLAGSCPRCRSGRVFAGWVRMHRTCPECGLVFEREPGYFLGAMYLSYGLGILVAAPVALGLHLGLGVSVEVSAWSSGAVLVVASPWLFRSSRVGWLHFDQHFHPR